MMNGTIYLQSYCIKCVRPIGLLLDSTYFQSEKNKIVKNPLVISNLTRLLSVALNSTDMA